MRKTITNIPKLVSLLFALLFVSTSTSVMAQSSSEDDDDFSFTVGLTSDQFFGFAPSFSGSYGLSSKVGLTFYGIMWSGGTGGAWGNWTEFGVGANFNLADGISFNPSLGVTGGNLLSSGTAGPAIFGDGIVPNMFLNLDKSNVEGEVYFGYYAPLRDKVPAEGGTTLSYIHYWANLGYKVNPRFSFGGHFEHLINSGGSNVTSSSDVYQWVGPYIQFSSPKHSIFGRLSAGGDLVEGNDSFFKVSTGFSF
ncbi:hypothetical protein FVR03_08810 [Pontibacter qinzhouensis]|uniref:Uncharacterized protein n=1 Tax=Pontibacter qinzhouensis TaxID=2603253 RepID=A0A5C8KBT7_9BACT|nr:DUF6733 family protein [Pontibacter qinzhouensis]TXK47957.1 hypothetical protein FVR03_08810 [Pontibacter qinzhouensis]